MRSERKESKQLQLGPADGQARWWRRMGLVFQKGLSSFTYSGLPLPPPAGCRELPDPPYGLGIEIPASFGAPGFLP